MPSEATPRVSVVLPVFDTAEYLQQALDSLSRQDLAPGDLEVIAVDDGSTDGSAEMLDRWAEQTDFATVLHQPNSGWPGQPRNRALERCTGTYVFFMDSDDYLGDGTLRRLADYADEQDSDVVVPKLVAVGGGTDTVPTGSDVPWGRGRTADADLERVFHTLMPQKLLRRSLLVEHGLRFPEGKIRLEDGIFLSQAYLLARRVSTVGDADYYFKRHRAAGDNISAGGLDPHSYAGSIRTILENVRRLCRDPAQADRLVALVYRRKALKVFAPDRFLAYPPERRAAWVEAVGALARDLLPPELEATLPEPLQTRSRLARAGDLRGQVELAWSLSDTTPSLPPVGPRRVLNRLGLPGPGPLPVGPVSRLQVRVTSAAVGREGLELEGRARLRGAPPAYVRLVLGLHRRGSEGPPLELEAEVSPVDVLGWQSWRVVVARARAASLPLGRWDLQLRTAGGELLSSLGAEGVYVPVGTALPVSGGALVPYVRRRGGLGLRPAGRAPDA